MQSLTPPPSASLLDANTHITLHVSNSLPLQPDVLAVPHRLAGTSRQACLSSGYGLRGQDCIPSEMARKLLRLNTDLCFPLSQGPSETPTLNPSTLGLWLSAGRTMLAHVRPCVPTIINE